MRIQTWPAILLLSLACTHVASAAPDPFVECRNAASPPKCLVARAAADSEAADYMLAAVIFTGSVELVETYAKELAAAAKGKFRSGDAFLKSLGVTPPERRGAEQHATLSDKVALAAVALAAAAQGSDEPFSNPTVMRMLKDARNSPAIAQVAVRLWKAADTSGEWGGDQKLTRPRGMPSILNAIVAMPPEDSAVLVDLANDLSWVGYTEEGLKLLRIAMGRTNLSANMRMSIASLLARRYRLADEAQRMFDTAGASTGFDRNAVQVGIAEARLHHAYDAASAKLVVESCLAGLNQASYQSYESQGLKALEVSGAKEELLHLGDVYLEHARESEGDAESRGDWYALASEAYRGARQMAKAVAAAREGLPFVEPAIIERISHGSKKPKPIIDRRAAAVQAVYGDAPVIALYRAGARDEALATGFLTGYDRYIFAKSAGEVPDPVWVFEDESTFLDGIVLRMMIESGDSAGAARSYRYRRCHDIFGPNRIEEANRQLGLLAALSGRRRTMSEHFANAANAIDSLRNGTSAKTKAWAVFELAADWQRGLNVADRVTATDTNIETSCDAG
jgi:hypothetical protein